MANVQISELSDLSSPAWADLLPADKADGLSTGKIPFSTLAYLALANWKWKSPVVAVASSNVSIASGLENGDTVDSVTLATGQRVLLTAQTTATENGIYVVPASGAASRATDMDSSSEFIGAVVAKSSTGDVYVCTAKPDFTLGTDTPSFVLCSSTTGQQRTFMGVGTGDTPTFAGAKFNLSIIRDASMSGNLTLTAATHNATVLVLDPNGADRNVTAWPTPTSGANVVVRHIGTANVLNFKDNGGTLKRAVTYGESVLMMYDGVDWIEG